ELSRLRPVIIDALRKITEGELLLGKHRRREHVGRRGHAEVSGLKFQVGPRYHPTSAGMKVNPSLARTLQIGGGAFGTRVGCARQAAVSRSCPGCSAPNHPLTT